VTGLVVLALRVLALFALYAFLGLALWIMWQELRRGLSAGSGSGAPPIRLEVRSRNREVVVRQFTQPDVVLGRDPASDVPLADIAVSAQHAQLRYHHGQWWVRDLGSRNGTRLNRQRLDVPTVLTTGDEIRCGAVRMLVTLPAKGGDSDAVEEDSQNE
jgi:pSer/pThr/pTyr-binding forkhead associated (FHA) protein